MIRNQILEYRLVREKVTVLLSTSQAWPNCGWLSSFTSHAVAAMKNGPRGPCSLAGPSVCPSDPHKKDGVLNSWLPKPTAKDSAVTV